MRWPTARIPASCSRCSALHDGFLVAYAERVGKTSEVRVQRIDADGTADGDALTIDGVGERAPEDLHLAQLDAGNVLLAWFERDARATGASWGSRSRRRWRRRARSRSSSRSTRWRKRASISRARSRTAGLLYHAKDGDTRDTVKYRRIDGDGQVTEAAFNVVRRARPRARRFDRCVRPGLRRGLSRVAFARRRSRGGSRRVHQPVRRDRVRRRARAEQRDRRSHHAGRDRRRALARRLDQPIGAHAGDARLQVVLPGRVRAVRRRVRARSVQERLRPRTRIRSTRIRDSLGFGLGLGLDRRTRTRMVGIGIGDRSINMRQRWIWGCLAWILGGCASACAGAAGCARGRQALRFTTQLDRDHPLVGRIFDVAQGRFVSEQECSSAWRGARFVALGEQHDNADHHLLQARVVRALVARELHPAVVFEMLDLAQQPNIDRALAARPDDVDGLGARGRLRTLGLAGVVAVSADLRRGAARPFADRRCRARSRARDAAGERRRRHARPALVQEFELDHALPAAELARVARRNGTTCTAACCPRRCSTRWCWSSARATRCSPSACTRAAPAQC